MTEHLVPHTDLKYSYFVKQRVMRSPKYSEQRLFEAQIRINLPKEDEVYQVLAIDILPIGSIHCLYLTLSFCPHVSYPAQYFVPEAKFDRELDELLPNSQLIEATVAGILGGED